MKASKELLYSYSQNSLTLYVGGVLEFQSMKVLEHLPRSMSCFCRILEDPLE